MLGISIRYQYEGDEAVWEQAVADFIDAIDADEELGERFRYQVNVGKDGKTRIHWGSWDKPETVQILQSRDYFKTFSSKIGELAGDSLSPVQFRKHAATRNGRWGFAP